MLAAALAIHSVWALADGKSVGWITGLVAVALSSVVYFMKPLYGQLALQLYFGATSVYGWYYWRKSSHQSDNDFIPIPRVEKRVMVFSVLVVLLGWLASWYLLKVLNGLAPGLDAIIAALSILAQWWQTRKYIWAWWLWIVVNVASVTMFLMTDLYTFALLYTALLLLAIKGGLQWRDMYNARKATA